MSLKIKKFLIDKIIKDNRSLREPVDDIEIEIDNRI